METATKPQRKTFTQGEKCKMHKIAQALPADVDLLERVRVAQEQAGVPLARRQDIKTLSGAERLLRSWGNTATPKLAPVVQMPSVGSLAKTADPHEMSADDFDKMRPVLKAGWYLVEVK